MKRLLFLAFLVLVGTGLVSGVGWIYLSWAATQPAAAAAGQIDPPKMKPLPDVDALAARMKQNHEIYEKVRDQAFAAYAGNHPGPHPYNDEARMTLRLGAYLAVWDDFYGEGLWQALEDHATHLTQQGCNDQVWLSFVDFHWTQFSHSSDDSGVAELNTCSSRLGKTDYPDVWKLNGFQVAMSNILKAKENAKGAPVTAGMPALPDLEEGGVAAYGQLIAQKYPPSLLFTKGKELLDAVQDDEPTLKAVSEGLDRAFEAQDRENPMAGVLDGSFYVNDAWNARGSNWASTVTAQGWQSFGERLARADGILTDLYSKYPDEPGIADVMMVVVLGQQQPRDQMELWFGRGIKIDPNDFSLYRSKRWYLLPRWYGSDEDVWNFGMECSTSTNWEGKVPLMLVEAISDRAENDPTVYARDEIWGPVEKIYRAYLDRYPASIKYRTWFARCAVQGQHWDVAREQLKILGDDWDRKELTDDEYADLTRQVQAH